MILNDLLNTTYSNITIAVKVGDLMLFAESLIKRAKEELIVSPKIEEPDELIPAKKLCEILDIKPPTLYKWQRQGYIAPLHIGGRAYYRRSDILNINKGCKISA